jgi:transposase InsO family protein
MATTLERITTKDVGEKLARQRLSVLQLAEELGSVASACRRAKMDRTSFYEWKRRFQLYGLTGLKDLPPVHRTHPLTTPPEVIERMLALSAANPTWGCVHLSDQLKLAGITLSSPTIQKALIERGLGSKYERLLRFEEHAASHALPLTTEQVRWLEAANPCYRERHIESSRPGELLAQDTFFVGHFKGVGRVYLQAVVDTFGSYAFGALHTSKRPETAVALLHNDVLPQYEAWGLPVGAVLTDNGREFCGTETHVYELYLALTDIAHRRTKVRSPQTNGFVERFHRTVLEEFFAITLRETFYEALEPLQTALDAWLIHYNRERPHRGYRNMGRRPLDTITKFLSPVRQEG